MFYVLEERSCSMKRGHVLCSRREEVMFYVLEERRSCSSYRAKM